MATYGGDDQALRAHRRGGPELAEAFESAGAPTDGPARPSGRPRLAERIGDV